MIILMWRVYCILFSVVWAGVLNNGRLLFFFHSFFVLWGIVHMQHGLDQRLEPG